MIVKETEASIFTFMSQSLVCPVNTVGTLGAGLALQFKNKFPGLDKAYKLACHMSAFKRAGFLVYHSKRPYDDRRVVCLPTKTHWRENSSLALIDFGLWHLARDWKEAGITSLSVPALGSGLGKLNWENVYEVIKSHLEDIELPVIIHLPRKEERLRPDE